MTFDRFKELWEQAGLNNLPKHENPLVMQGASQRTIDALIAEADGDPTAFEKVCAVMTELDEAYDEIRFTKIYGVYLFFTFNGVAYSLCIDPVDESMQSAQL